MSALPTAERRRLWREAASLSRSRLATTRGAKVGAALSWGLLLAFAGATLAARYGRSGTTDLSGFGPTTARAAAWLAAGPIAISAANGRERGDRADGIEALAATFGVGSGALRAGRLGGVAFACARAIALPSLFVTLLGAALAGAAPTALKSLLVAPVVVAFALVAGAVLALVASLAERVSPERGMRTFLLLVLVPWAVADTVGWSGASVPGALDALLTASLVLVGGAA